MARCFVIQGFHKKQDFPTGRLLDLDASYEVIREAVVDAGLECVRADEIRHSGTIDTPMFEQILSADLVIADLSTYNVNAAYELGVRHALRPHATIIVAESGFKYPFDFSHIAIQQYTHLGDDIGRREAMRFKTELKSLIEEVMAEPSTDSPVYVFVPGLEPPAARRGDNVVPPPPPSTRGTDIPPPPLPSPAMNPPDPSSTTASRPVDRAASDTSGDAGRDGSGRSIKSMTDEARAALEADNFIEARDTLLQLLDTQDGLPRQGGLDDAVIQMLALATYKSREPSPEAALLAARDLLLQLDPESSNDAETVGLWGAVHKGLWELNTESADFDTAIAAYERGFHLQHDYYNGINFAYLLNVRADQQRAMEPAPAIADWVMAERTRSSVVKLCRRALDELPEIDAEMSQKKKDGILEKKYWILATLEEAAVGLGDDAGAEALHAEAAAAAPAPWMTSTTADQIARLRQLLVNPPTRAIAGPTD